MAPALGGSAAAAYTLWIYARADSGGAALFNRTRFFRHATCKHTRAGEATYGISLLECGLHRRRRGVLLAVSSSRNAVPRWWKPFHLKRCSAVRHYRRVFGTGRHIGRRAAGHARAGDACLTGRRAELIIPNRRAAEPRCIYLRDNGAPVSVELQQNATRQQLSSAPAVVERRAERAQPRHRSWEKELLIIGGSAGAGAGIPAR